MSTTLDIKQVLSDPDAEAAYITNQFTTWEQLRNTWMKSNVELRNYLFATDTTTTSNKALPWKNTTTVPKLTQIRDNLHANYMEALFPNEDWLIWEGNDQDAEMEAKRAAIESYMRTKLRQDNAEVLVSQLILDWIDTGNCFATSQWADESHEDRDTPKTIGEVVRPRPQGSVTRGYVGPRIVRISPYDIVFNPLAPSFEKAPKILRKLSSLGELTKQALKLDPSSDERMMLLKALNKSVQARQQVRQLSQGDTFKSDGYTVDGFASMQVYFQSDYVEVLTFYGDLYDLQTGKFYENRVITIMDRSWVISNKPNPNWTTTSGIFHCGWRLRPDNLYAQGPLHNLVGMQYRMDHLENLKADVFDMIAYPMTKIQGYVEDFDYGPGMRVVCGDEGDVEFLHPPHESLNADNQILELERRMEELVGAPKEAMGIRTPGEKTKYEVQKLDNAASRIFQNKIEYFQKVLLQPLINFMLQLARRNMSAADVSRTLDSDLDAVIFSSVTKEDITANGILRPVGAQHFAERANSLQNLIGILNTPAYQDQQVSVHWSGKALAKAMASLADLDKYHIYGENIRVIEGSDTRQLMSTSGEQSDVAAATPPGITEGDPASASAAKSAQVKQFSNGLK